MPRFFVPPSAIQGDYITIVESDAAHISRSLRMKIGDPLTVCDMQKTEYDCRIAAINASSVTLSVLASKPSQNEPPYKAMLYMALPKADKMELIIQKAVELGVSDIIPYRSERSVVKLDEQSGAKKQQRWQKIADAAAGQCGRGILPTVHAPVSFQSAVQDAKNAELAFLCFENENGLTLPALLARHPQPPKSVAFFVGAEGGIAPDEHRLCQEAGIVPVGLGNRILRCETAPLFVLTCLSCFWEF